jgi:oxygen-independent coproporphyrinogen-3 oxidase
MTPADSTRTDTTSSLSLPPLALYIHLPWCVRKCPYCDFNSHQQPEQLPETAYVDALLADLDQDLPLVWGRPLVSIFFGGGTPSLFSGAAIGRILDGVRARLRLRPEAEITLETNPGTAEYGRFEDYRVAGVNRLSFGVQSFDDAQLRKLGRIHASAEVYTAFESARRAGFDNINLDLMYALPGQSLAQALDDLAKAVAMGPEHLSHYHLTLEPNTVFAARPPADLPDHDAAWAMQEACQLALAAAGYVQYEISAYARPGRRSQHNLNYWRFGDYLGIGAGAHGKITDLATGQIRRIAKQRHPRLYLEVAASATRVQSNELLSADQLPFEFMLNALRLVDGFAISDYRARTGLDLRAHPAFTRSIQRGLLVVDAERVQPTELGQRFLNDLMAEFL